MRDTDARLRKGIGNALLALAMVALSAAPAAAQQDIGNLMRQKLDRAQGLFEAVVLARFPAVARYAGDSAAHQRTVHLDADDGAGVSSPRGGVSGSRAKPRSGGRRPRHRRGFDRLHDPDVELRCNATGCCANPAGPSASRIRTSRCSASPALVRFVRPTNDGAVGSGACADRKARRACSPAAMSRQP